MKYHSSFRSVYLLTAHVIFITKYRKKVITSDMLSELETAFQSVLEKWDSKLLEFNGEPDHIHMLIDYPPQKLLSNLIANMKSTGSKAMWRNHEEYLKTKYWGKKVFWSGSYFVASCGGVTVEQLKEYVQNQDSPK